jgi:hypothetical protein
MINLDKYGYLILELVDKTQLNQMVKLDISSSSKRKLPTLTIVFKHTH